MLVDGGDTAEDLLAQAESDDWIVTDGLDGMRAALDQVRAARAEAAAEDTESEEG